VPQQFKAILTKVQVFEALVGMSTIFSPMLQDLSQQST
jgi:hypothetical protein